MNIGAVSDHACAWVTQALADEDVSKALVLGKSLRKVLTRKKLVVVVHPTISLALRDVLESTFDFVLSLDQQQCGKDGMKMSRDNLAKIFAMSFTFFDECVYLPPSSLVVKNCDTLFGSCAEGKGRSTPSPVLHFRPNKEASQQLRGYLCQNNERLVNTDETLLKWIQNQPRDTVEFLHEPYATTISLLDKQLLKNDDELAICILMDLPANLEELSSQEKNGFSKAGLLEKFIYGYWLEIFQNDVKIPTKVIDANPQPPTFKRFGNSTKEPIAVVGMSCRYPSSNNINEFWELLIEGRDGIRDPPEYRWSKEQSIFHNPETRKTQAGFLTVPVDEFDAKFFGISPKEIIFIDPQHRLLHELVWEALEDAAINPLDLNGTLGGVFMGSWRNDYYDILQRSSSMEFYRGYMGNSIGAGAARISHLLGLTGPCIATESGCSAAVVAVHMACRSLQNGESSMALALGVNLLLHPFTQDIMPMVTSPDGHCKSFAANADGFGRAEGCGVLVLKRLSVAVRDGDSIWGTIRGTAIAQEGISKSMGTPTVNCESQAMRNALRDASVHPSQISYVESHGTGTIVGDPMEIAAISRVYSGEREQPLVIGSVKTNVGHTESCSGVTGIMKVLLSMRNQVIPPHQNFKELNPDINLDIIPAKLPLEPICWPKTNGKPRIAGVSSFGITGTDAHIIIQEPLDDLSQRIVLKDFERPLHIMTVSARTEEALDALLERYKSSLSSDNCRDAFANMAYTANVGRANFNWRAAIIAKDSEEAVGVLNSNKLLRSEIASESMKGKVCFLFTGQGSRQSHGMAKELYLTCRVFQMSFNRCQDILKTRHKIDLANALWGKDEELINRTLYSQTGIFVVEYCLMKLWESWGVKPDYVLGHSLGEFGAAVCAGILTLEEALTLVAERSRLIDALPQGKMLVIKADKSSVDNLLKSFIAGNKESGFWLDYAAVNASDQTVLAGDSENILRFSEWLKEKNVKSMVLQSSHAFHSRHMDPMLKEYKQIAEKLLKSKKEGEMQLNCTYVSGMKGQILNVESSSINWPEYWVEHTREKVSFLSASKAVYNEAGCRLFLEVGPHPVLTAFTMMNNDGRGMLCLPSLRRNETDWKTILNTVGKLYVNGAVDLDWKRFDQFYARKKVGQLLPKYAFQGTKYWPTITNKEGVQIHPLLGSNISNPTNAKLFQNNLNLQNVEYLKDHVIGQMVVFPGAGYIETLLMAGHAALDGATTEFRLPRKPIQLENFRIESPMGLEEGTGCLCQTVVELLNTGTAESSGTLHVQLYHELKETEETSSKWVSHAQASFAPYNLVTNESLDVEDAEAYLEKVTRLKKEGEEENSTSEFYDKVADIGLKFGPTFRTLQKVWRGLDKEKEFLAQVDVPSDQGAYLVHPTLIDAMIQASVFHGERNKKIEKKLHVPIGCEKFIWLRPLAVGSAKNTKIDEESSDANLSDDYCYIYSRANSKTVVLLDQEFNPVAAMVKVEAIETNARSIQALLETQTKSVPDMYKMNWKSTLGLMQKSLDFHITTDIVDIVSQEPADQTVYSVGVLQLRKDEDNLSFYYILSAFLKLGWNPKVGDTILLDQFVSQFGIKKHHKQLIRQFFIVLEQEGILSGVDVNDERQWTVIKAPQSLEKLHDDCEEILERQVNGDCGNEFLLLRDVGLKMDKILNGTESALRILFPDDESKPSVAKFYDSCFRRVKHMIYRQWTQLWQNYKTEYEAKNLPVPTIRLLEVGAGTGSVSEAILDSLHDAGLKYEFHYTDISAVFFAGAEKRFEKHRKSLIFRKLNLEQDPTSQNYPPKYFDFIMAAQVIHATRDIKETFLNMRLLLKDRGNMSLNESLGGKRMFDCIFGVIYGFWRFTDFDLRPHHAMMTYDKWEQVGLETGFSLVDHVKDNDMALITYRASDEAVSYDVLSRTLNENMRQIQEKAKVAWVLLYGDDDEEYVLSLKKKFEFIGRKSIILVKTSQVEDTNLQDSSLSLQHQYGVRVESLEDIEKLFGILTRPTNKNDPNGYASIEGVLVAWGLCYAGRDQGDVARPFLHLVQNVLKLDKKATPQIVVLTCGQYPQGDILCPNPTSSTLLGMSRCISNEHSELKLRGIDIDPTEMYSSMDEIFQEIFTGFYDEVAHFCAFRKRERFVPRIMPEKVQTKVGSLALPQCTDRFQLVHPKSKSIQDLEFGDLDPFLLKPNEIEVKVKCSALNFKDIFNILKPTEEFRDSDGVGFDFAGVVTAIGHGVTQRKVGEPVFGINIMGNALPSHIKLPEDAVASVPDSLTFTEAACFPAVFSTAYYCLVQVAQVKKGETLLIHTASGGVGLLTIQLAKYFGLNIICTAGNKRKRAYLRSLGVQHVFHSRNTDFGQQIMKVTNGGGINVVLNTITGPGFKEATLGCCAPGARFVEMSKLNIWTPEEVAQKRPDVQYTVVDLTKVDEEESRMLLAESRNLVENGVVKPIPYTRYDAQDIREALQYLQNAQHIGKVLVTMPETIPGQMDITQLYTPLFSERSTYIITGGLGGVGFEVCKYVAYQGAKNIVLVGRNPPTEKVLEAIENVKNEHACKITVFQADVGEWYQCKRVFDEIKNSVDNFPPIRGIMHCAGTLADALIDNSKWEDFQTTYQAKVKGTWNLHDLTKDIILEHFVLFSSITSPFGNPGQSTHVSACTFEDTMAYYRSSRGLACTSINWGQWGQIGIAADADVVAIRPFSPQQGISALDVILRQNRNYIIVASFEKALSGVIKYLPYTKKVVDDSVLKVQNSGNSSKRTLQISSDQFWEEYTECKDEREAKVEVIKRYTKVMLRHVLRMDADEPIDENSDLQDLGVDSLMMLELKNHLQEILGDRVQVTQSAMKDCTTVNLLADRLVQVIEEEGEFAPMEAPTLDEIREMVIEDSKLPQHIKAQVLGSEKKPSEIKILLMTGATGSLGSHMLREVLKNCPQLEKIYCLIRTRGGELPQEKLASVLERKCITGSLKNFEKVQCISENFIEERLGLPDAEYFVLSNEVDAILHCGAKVSHVEFYRNVPGGRNDARSVNVGGLLRVLEFAGLGRTKHVFNAGTMLAVYDVNEQDKTVGETWPTDTTLPFNRGYLVSKYVGDILLREANERGIPSKSFRFAELRGSTVTKGSRIENSHFMKLFLFFMKAGIIPETPFPCNFLAIDKACELSLRVMFNDQAPNEAYNISHPRPQLLQEFFPKLAKEFGHNVQIVSVEEYRKKMEESLQGDKNEFILSEFEDLYKDDNVLMSLTPGSITAKSVETFIIEGNEEFFKSKKLSVYCKNLYTVDQLETGYELVRRDFIAGQSEGILEKLGL